jgi:hypothetical protein
MHRTFATSYFFVDSKFGKTANTRGFVCLLLACFTAHQHLFHIGPTLSVDKEYIRRGIAISRLLRQAGLGRGSILPTRCHTGKNTKNKILKSTTNTRGKTSQFIASCEDSTILRES